MARVRQFAAALVAFILALVAAVVGVLTLTVWKPADQVQASTTPDHPYVMTRDKVLPLLAQDVTVTVTAPGDEQVSLVLGTTGDVLGWIGDSPYTEVVGIESGMENLKTVDHPGSGGDAQSGAQSGGAAQSGPLAQSGDEGAQPGDLAQSGESPAGNDMWLQEATGRGTTSLTLTDVAAGRSVLAAVDGSADAPELTLTWAVHRANAPAVVAWALAALFALIASLFFVSELRILRHRKRRALVLAERAGADVTDTQLIPLDQVRAMVEEDDRNGTGVPGGLATGAMTDDDTGTGPATPGTEPGGDDTGAGEVTVEDSTEAGEVPEDTSPEDAQPAPEDAQPAPEDALPAPEDAQPAPEDAQPAPEDALPAPEDATTAVQVERTPLLGRHGGSEAPLDEDPPVREPKDSGVIDVSAIREGVAFPTRRVLREAREKGQHSVVVDGHEFDTGLIPQVSKVGTETGTDTGEDTPAERDADAGTDPGADSEEAHPTHGGSWTSLVSGWIHGERGKDHGKNS